MYMKTWKYCSQLIDFSKPATNQVQVGQRAMKYNHPWLRGKPNVGLITKVTPKSFVVTWKDGDTQRCIVRFIKGNRGFEPVLYEPLWSKDIQLEVEVEIA